MAASTTARGDAPLTKVVKTSLDDEDPFADIDMPDDDEGLDTENARMQVLDKRYAEEKAKLQQGVAKQLRAHTDMDLAKAGLAAEASALAGRAAAGAAAVQVAEARAVCTAAHAPTQRYFPRTATAGEHLAMVVAAELTDRRLVVISDCAAIVASHLRGPALASGHCG